MSKEAKTPEEIARDIRLNVPWFTSLLGQQHDHPDWDALELLITAAIRDAYEQAAQLAELDGASDACLSAIRKLKNE